MILRAVIKKDQIYNIAHRLMSGQGSPKGRHNLPQITKSRDARKLLTVTLRTFSVGFYSSNFPSSQFSGLKIEPLDFH
jgi:hypothetical protein